MTTMTTAANGKTRLPSVMICRCQGCDTFGAFQLTRIFRIHFFQNMSAAPLFFSVPAPYPVKSPVLQINMRENKEL